ncbi:hypothetical protein B0H19DRAFT_528922 [Mycena capillaripes]|nr:hypothetical protein B0H19DRAFT_528922 [Mycena capillaripes]
MQVLHDVVQAGYVGYIGMSSCYAWQCHAMQIFRLRHRQQTDAIHLHAKSLLALVQEEEREMFPTPKIKFPVYHIIYSCTKKRSRLARDAISRPLSQQSKRAKANVLSTNFYTRSPAGANHC